jgi:fumarylacetoacetase
MKNSFIVPPHAKSWLNLPADTDFSLHNIPFGIGHIAHSQDYFACTRFGDWIVRLDLLFAAGYFSAIPGLHMEVFKQASLNQFLALGPEVVRMVRKILFELFESGNEAFAAQHVLHDQVMLSASKVQMLLPVKVGDYTDFYSSKEHAFNVGVMFRGPENALMPNWKHLPVGYHGRASSIVVSGVDVVRPKGQFKPQDAENPIFGPTRQLDFELEMAFVVGKENPLGSAVAVADAEEHIAGLCLFNDWSARDIQSWEYQPLGPFLGKNFASSMSPWLVTLDALAPFEVEAPQQDPKPLPYLLDNKGHNFNINLELWLQPEGEEATLISSTNHKYLYWTIAQQLAHHTVNGCNLQIGDVCASGTISGPTEDSYGSMLELTWRGTKPLTLKNGSTRTFLEDGDTVIIKGYAANEQIKVGLGEVRAKVLPAIA